MADNKFVPIRIVAKGPNVVPVEIVLVDAIGVVPVRQFVGPANVVPVYTTVVDTPRVKVLEV